MNKKIILALVIAFYLFTRLPFLGIDMTNSDAARWHRRSERFLTAIKQLDFASTYQHYQPGVTIMWINSVTKFVVGNFQKDPAMTLENADWFPIIDGISKAVLVFILLGLLLLQIFLISKLFNSSVALGYGVLISVEPYMIGIDRWFHLTSLETYLAFTSFLLLLHWRQHKIIKYLLLSGVFLGCSILSKLTTLVLVPLFILFIFYWERKIKFVALYALVLLASLFLLFPAFWVNGINVVGNLVSAITNAVSNDIRADELSSSLRIIFYPVVLAFKLSPLTLLFFVFALFSFKKIKSNTNALYIFGYFCYYLLFLTIPEKKIDRYALVLIPPIVLICSYYLESFILYRKLFLYTVSCLFLVFVIYSVFPVYSAYYSPLFGGTKGALKAGIYDNSGEYFAQAALYLNTLGRDLNTFVPDNIEAFSPYYKGKIQRVYDDTTDYVVRSIDIDRKEIQDSKCPYIVREFGPNDYNVVAVLMCPGILK